MDARTDVKGLMRAIGLRAQDAALVLAEAETDTKDAALRAAADAIEAASGAILAANARDMEAGREKGLSAAMLDRLLLTGDRIRGMAEGVRSVAGQPDPVGAVMAEWDRPTGLKIRRVRTPIGVVGVIYESRPNVTADAGALCLKSGNAVILRGGSESFDSARAIHAAMLEGLRSAGLTEDAIQMVPTTDRAAVGEMLGMSGVIDVIVPRGGKGLVARVQAEARVPVFAHLEGIVHVYVDKAADIEKARQVVLNSKTRRTGICGAAECLLIDRALLPDQGRPVHLGSDRGGCRSTRRRGPSGASRRHSRIGVRLGNRISRQHHRGPRRGRRGWSGGAYPTVRIKAHRLHPHGGRHGGGSLLPAVGQRDSDAKRLDAVRGRRRVRNGRGDRDRHRKTSCARPRGGRAADEFQVSR